MLDQSAEPHLKARGDGAANDPQEEQQVRPRPYAEDDCQQQRRRSQLVLEERCKPALKATRVPPYPAAVGWVISAQVQ